MMKFNKEKIESFIGWVGVLFVMINIFFPIVGIIAGVLFVSQNYMALIYGLLGIVALLLVIQLFRLLFRLEKN